MGGLRAGSRIGRYIIRNKLGRGGMGVVYGAYDPELSRGVALKLVRHRESPGSVEIHVDERLHREAQALARLSHPNVVSLYDIGACDHGAFLAMELVPGMDLAKWLKAQRRSWTEIVKVFLLAGRGLAAAHTAGVMHRDFKPTNVIVGPQGHVTVVDFGLARSTELATTVSDTHFGEVNVAVSDALSTRLTGTNVIVGTRAYMAPEQLLGLSVGPRCDQFSFCVALFEALYGVRPYPGKNAVETANSFARGELVALEDRHGVPARLHRLLVKGLSIEPDERFPSMEALLAALRRTQPSSELRVRAGWLAALVTTAMLSAGAATWIERSSHEPAVTTSDDDDNADTPRAPDRRDSAALPRSP